MTNENRRGVRIGVIAVASSVVLTVGQPAAVADEGEKFTQPPGYEAPPAPEIDPEAPGLKLGDGATLAEPKVLDIKFVIEDLGSTEDNSADEDGSGGGPTGGGATPDPGEGEAGGGLGAEQREERTGSQHKFTLQSDVLFGKGSDEITDEARGALKDVAAAIDEYRPHQVNIFGFTDNLGSYESGKVLSRDRAQNTHQVLVQLIADPSGITFAVRGYSEDYPIYDNSTEEGRQGNRRVEISWPSKD